ncbi:Lipoprotein lpqB [Actinoplanes sp. SE50]|uniref:LpqB family beta-propeller domain-containing protein n=1 Tax=unclassified Actinoplanes TaxID=2626549 RepID=UPI00023EC721|nr:MULTISPECIES: LpqB family beta-propeller domain-containing protein [unclassified Actinoplanes]AEV81965.1 Lipoprotein lpqB [Actinoplanes sp. SE50/110]ATO80365.1 Lipoprotein lpqB [Actinoplanes sp. SE50]SLL97771.1 Lipoprotein lpqB [Actinoplanes sp. SE50/110]
MSRRLIALPLAGLLAVLVTGSCGIPDDSGVTVVGPGPSAGINPGDYGGSTQVTRGSESTDHAAFVENYLKAASGDLDTATDRLRAFMSRDAATAFKPNTTGLKVIRLVQPPLPTPGSEVVEVKYQTVGTLDKFGLLTPEAESRTDVYRFRVGPVGGQDGLFVKDAPPNLLISTDALSVYYREHAIYFWNTDYTALVPDVRYMPNAVPVEQRPTTILNWMANGPASWLSVSDLADGFGLIGKVVPAINGTRLQITLNEKSLPATDTALALDRLRKQLQWSLRPLLPDGGELDIKISFKDVGSYTGGDYLASNPAYRLVPDNPDKFVVYDGRIHRVTGAANTPDQVPVLRPEDNKDIRAAAMSSSGSHVFAAVVAGKGDTLQVASAETGAQAALQPISGMPGPLGQPAWAITYRDDVAEGAIGLIPAGGRLYSFSAVKGEAQLIPWTGQGTRITAVAVAPDGRRVVLVVDGKLYRASLTTGGDTPALGSPQQIRPVGLDAVTAVGFSSEGWLSVAGPRASDKRATIIDMSIDGAFSSSAGPDLGEQPVDAISVYPANPTILSRSRWVSYTAGGKAWELLSKATLIGVDRLSGLPSSGAAPDKTPTAPFYLE